MMRVRLFVLLVAVVVCAGASALEQDSACPIKPSRHFGFIGGGASWLDISKVNDVLAVSNLTKFKEYAATVSIGMQNDKGRFIMEHVITGHFWKEKVSLNRRESLWSGDAFANCGFNVFGSETPAALYPYVGLGAAINTLQLRTDTKTFSECLTSNDRSLFLMQGAVLFNVGIGCDVFIMHPSKQRSMVVGIRAGYAGDVFTAKKWHSDGTTISEFPALKHDGGYIRLVLGGMGKGNCKHREKEDTSAAAGH
jgi:hypothetical protein